MNAAWKNVGIGLEFLVESIFVLEKYAQRLKNLLTSLNDHGRNENIG